MRNLTRQADSGSDISLGIVLEMTIAVITPMRRNEVPMMKKPSYAREQEPPASTHAEGLLISLSFLGQLREREEGEREDREGSTP